MVQAGFDRFDKLVFHESVKSIVILVFVHVACLKLQLASSIWMWSVETWALVDVSVKVVGHLVLG